MLIWIFNKHRHKSKAKHSTLPFQDLIERTVMGIKGGKKIFTLLVWILSPVFPFIHMNIKIGLHIIL
jgi:hypothetical protein